MTQIQIRRGSATEWTTVNPVLAEGEWGVETDTLKVKIGNGSSAWASLSYLTVGWAQVTGKPAVVAAGATAADARAAISAASLDVNGKVPVSELPNSIMAYQGTWNASTNSPTLADGTGDPGDVYRVSVAGSRNLGSGLVSFSVGDYVIYSPATSAWEKADTTDAVATVNGYTGNITLTKSDVGLGRVDNTSDATKNSAAVALTNKTAVTSTGTVTGLQLAATATTGTAPLTVSSTTLVSNLNADRVDNFDASELSRVVSITDGALGTQANHWYKIAQITTTDQYQVCNLSLLITSGSGAVSHTALAAVNVWTNGEPGYLPVILDAKMLAKTGDGVGAVKVLANAVSSSTITFDIWIKTGLPWLFFRIQELSKGSTAYTSVVYYSYQQSAWQSSEPTGVNGSSTATAVDLGTPSAGTLTNCTGLPVSGISATGTRDSTTYLRGDGTWAATSGGISTGKAIAMAMVFG